MNRGGEFVQTRLWAADRSLLLSVKLFARLRRSRRDMPTLLESLFNVNRVMHWFVMTRRSEISRWVRGERLFPYRSIRFHWIKREKEIHGSENLVFSRLHYVAELLSNHEQRRARTSAIASAMCILREIEISTNLIDFRWSNTSSGFRFHSSRCNQRSPTFLLRKGITRSVRSSVLTNPLSDVFDKRFFLIDTWLLVQPSSIHFRGHEPHAKEPRGTPGEQFAGLSAHLLSTEDGQE